MNSMDSPGQTGESQPRLSASSNGQPSDLNPALPDPREVRRERREAWGRWIRWMLRISLAGALCIGLGRLLYAWFYYLQLYNNTGVNPLDFEIFGSRIEIPSLVKAMLNGLIVGALGGRIQSRGLGAYLPAHAKGSWIVATMLGGTVAAIVVAPLFYPFLVSGGIFGFAPHFDAYIPCMIAGALIGVAQWFVLRSYLPGAGTGWWVLANSAGGLAGAFLTRLVLDFTAPLYDLRGFSYSCFDIPLFIVIGASVFLPLSALTGLVLARLPRRNNPE